MTNNECLVLAAIGAFVLYKLSQSQQPYVQVPAGPQLRGMPQLGQPACPASVAQGIPNWVAQLADSLTA